MQYDDTSKAILQKMYADTRIGGRHLGLQDLSRGFSSHERGNISKMVRLLIKDGLIQKHPTGYGPQYSLNPRAIKMIRDIIDISD